MKSLNLKIAAKTNFSFQIAKPIAAIGAQSLRRTSRAVTRVLDGRVGAAGVRFLELARRVRVVLAHSLRVLVAPRVPLSSHIGA